MSTGRPADAVVVESRCCRHVLLPPCCRCRRCLDVASRQSVSKVDRQVAPVGATA